MKERDIMTVYIALLRGINVGGHNIIKMAELKQLFESMGLYEVKTYIQSGNVVFKSNEEEEVLCNKIEHEINSVLGFSVTVMLRTSEELEQIITNLPFSEEEISKAAMSTEVETLYVALLTKAPLQEKAELLEAYKGQEDKYEIIGREVFLLFNNKSIRNSKLPNNLNKLDVPNTVRNWKTINKLASMARTMNSI